jgi:FkbM family methyltransferase
MAILASSGRRMATRLDLYTKSLRNLGIINTLALKAAHLRMRSLRKGQLVALRAPNVGSVLCRAHTSDLGVFRQIFIDREYRCLDDVSNPRLIIDCGANVGYASAYFLARYRDTRLIAVEPDAGNFSVLSRNLAPYSDRTTLIQSGIWSTETGLVMSEQPFADGREWSYTVRPARPRETPSMKAVDIGGLLSRSGFDRISILKIDVEGAEREIFRTHYQSWINKVDRLVIELHGPDCEAALMQALESCAVSISHCEELTVCSFMRAQ